MANTQGFEIVAELAPALLLQTLQAAWKSGSSPGTTDCPGASIGVIPQNFNIPPSTSFGPYTIQDGQVQVPENGLDVQMAPDVNGVRLQFELDMQVHLKDPPTPSAGMLSMVAIAAAKVPIDHLPGQINVAMLLAGLPRGNVTVTLPGGDPIAPNIDAYLTDYVHQLYKADGPSFPHNVPPQPMSFTFLGNTVNAEATVDVYDDPQDSTHQIQVTFPSNNQIQIVIPIHLKMFNITPSTVFGITIWDPMGVEAQVVLPGSIVNDQSTGTLSVTLDPNNVTVQNLVPAPGTYDNQGPTEGPNYTKNNFGGLLESLIKTQLIAQFSSMVKLMGTIPPFNYPTVSVIENAIGDQFYQQLVAQGNLSVWTPQTGSGSPIVVNDVTVAAKSDVLAIALNSSTGASDPGDANNLVNFIPMGSSFAIALSAKKVLDIVNQSIKSQFPTFPHRFHNIDGHDVDLKSLNPSLTNAIHISGDLTVIDAILGSIDVDASFDVDIGLDWQTNPDGTQIIHSDPGEPDVDLSGLAWLVSILLGFITGGVVGVIIAVIIDEVVQNIASNIGGKLVVNQATNAVTGIGAWPSQLTCIGTVKAKFDPKITISPDGLLFGG